MSTEAAKGFKKEYWDKNYDYPETMDGVGNVKEHIKYIKYLFGIEYIDLNSVVDLGFGLGCFLKEFVREFKPYKVMGIEPSEHVFNQLSKASLQKIKTTKVKLQKKDLLTWARSENRGWDRFDFGFCTSVFQYLTDEELDEIVPIMAKRIRFIYFSVPTDKELKRQVSEVDFFDEYAIRRSKSYYQNLLKPHFTFVSARVLESKEFFTDDNTYFTDLLFRF